MKALVYVLASILACGWAKLPSNSAIVGFYCVASRSTTGYPCTLFYYDTRMKAYCVVRWPEPPPADAEVTCPAALSISRDGVRVQNRLPWRRGDRENKMTSSR